MKKRIITHNAGFHTDDVFAVATLVLLLGEDNVEIIRSRDPEVIKTGDYVVDVGSVYDEDKNRFDHHQKGGAGERENSIPYASYGLVWKKFGEKVCGSKEVSEALDLRIAQPIDAVDNGVDVCAEILAGVIPYDIDEIIHSYEPTWKESKDNLDDRFMDAVKFSKSLLSRIINNTKDEIEARDNIIGIYLSSENKSLIILEKEHQYGRFLITRFLSEFPEPTYFIHYRKRQDETTPTDWQVVAVTKNKNSLDLRKPFPEDWRGLVGQEFVNITGIEDAYLCHKGGFMCLVGSKEGAIKLAKLALEA